MFVIKVRGDKNLEKARADRLQKVPISDEDNAVLYAATNMSEFVTMALSDSYVQQYLNNIDAPSGRTYWQIFIEKLLKVLQSVLGVEIRKGSVLESAIYSTMELIVPPEKRQVVEDNASNPLLPSEYTGHSGGAYGADTDWDIIGREFGVKDFRHYRPEDSTSLSRRLRESKDSRQFDEG